MKKLLTFLLCIVFVCGALGTVGCGNTNGLHKTNNSQPQDSVGFGTSVQAVQLGGLVASTFSGGNGSSNENAVYLSKTITATVLPATALNKKVDFEVLWADDAELKNEDVSEYVVVEQETDGALTATVKCFQNFGDDTIVIRCITRDGGYEATCIVSYVGIASDIAIENVSGAELKHTEERGDYYELYTNNEYVFNFRGVNALGAAQSDNIKYWDNGYYHATVDGGQGFYTFSKGSLINTWGYLNNNNGTIVRSLIDKDEFYSVSYSRNEDGSLQVRISVNNITFDSYNKDGEYIYGTAAQNNINIWVVAYNNTEGERVVSSVSEDTRTIMSNRTIEAMNKGYFYVSAGWGHNNSLGVEVADVLSKIKFTVAATVNSVEISPQSIQF